MPRSASATATCWVIGGDGALASTEVWAHGRFRPGPPLLHGRKGHTATLLKDGRVLVAGDSAAPEIVDLRRGRSVAVPGGGVAGSFATATALEAGTTLIAGGYDDRIAISGAAFVAGRSR
jgi:hypothetical protein